jgi:tetratricopeptide (TPR) repeat protein
MYKSNGNYEDAEKSYKALLVSYERKLGAFHSETLLAVEYLGWLYRLMGRYEDSERFHSRLLQAKEQEPVVQYADILNCLTGLGWLYKKMSKYQMAESFYERALEISRHVNEPPNHDILKIVTELGAISLILGDYENSEIRYSYVLEQMSLLEGQAEISLLSNLGTLAEKLRLSGHFEKSVDLLRRKLKLVRRSVSGCSCETLWCIGELACLLCDVDRKDEAESLCNELTSMFAKCIDPLPGNEFSFDMHSAEIQYSILLNQLGQPDKAYLRVNQLISRLNGYTIHESLSASRQSLLLLALDLREAIENRLKQQG